MQDIDFLPADYVCAQTTRKNNNWLRIILEGGKETGRDAYSSVVRVKTSAGTLTKVKAGGSGFLSQSDPRLLFGLGQDASAQSVEVTWSNGRVEPFSTDAMANTTLLLRYGTGKAEEVQLAKTSLPDPLTKAGSLARRLKFERGKPFPALQITSVTGKKVAMGSLVRPGRRTIVNLWATWCVPCLTEMPELDRMLTAFAKNGVDLVGLNLDAEPGTKVEQFLKAVPVQYPIYMGGVPAIEQLFATEEMTVPLSVVLDENGKVVQLISGWSPETKKTFEVLAGRSGGGSH